MRRRIGAWFGVTAALTAAPAWAQPASDAKKPPEAPSTPAAKKPAAAAKPTSGDEPADVKEPADAKKKGAAKKGPNAKKPADAKKPDAAPKTEVKKADAKAEGDADEADDDEKTEKKSAREGVRTPEPAPDHDEEQPLPPPGPPTLGEQGPPPYLVAPRPGGRERHLDVGPDVGIWSRPAQSDGGVSYSPGFAWGLHLRVELLSFLGFRAYYVNSQHAVSVPESGLGVTGSSIDQPALNVMQLGARLEPTWVVMPNLRLWAGVGAAWGRVTAGQPTDTGSSTVRYNDRSGVFVEWSGALGVSWDPIPKWLCTTLSLSGGLLTNQTGELFQDEQVVNSTSGLIERIDGLPRFASSYSAMLGVGVVL